ncbi:division/cell wall cluster transcriptional repressor MraZ [Candidatus Spongiihabitans sp.]|uniref:division/cell wall cluster transcriptional repressor MraZ n=1 Tax=Candidatus Spongiihabitans sp. TaxID=3101308 RepID=UPI003C7DC06F
MIRGANTLNLDDKGRLAIPSRFRNALMDRCGGKMIVTVNNTKEHCLWLYPLDEWELVEQKIVALPSFDANHQRLKRFLLGYASDVEMDGSGRILLPAPLREFAMMTKSVLLVGQGNKFEIWSEQLWNARRSQWLQEDMDLENLSVEMEQLSL